MLRTAADVDVEMMRSWRNQEANRDISINSHEISAEEHRSWWQAVSTDPGRRVLIFEVDGRPLGVVTFFDIDLNSDLPSAAWGFYLDHHTVTAEGTAMLAWMKVMAAAIDYAFDVLMVDVLYAEVLEHNDPVRRMNRRYRFVEGTPEERTVDDRAIAVIPLSLHRADRRAVAGREVPA
ncbi:GNAT family N-acetyltransferase [Nocardioides insulae]|uniref:GNAT family N-acetyltransferase n=1 Tax=Nocardioides insulae TaxID=394734 RepID=UPI000491B0F8|nr:GNAT family N-acetyltransferase [Nocardioides insulae]